LLLVAFSFSVYTTDQLLFHIRWVGRTNAVLHNLEFLLPQVKEMDALFQNRMTADTIKSTYNKQYFHTIDSLGELLEQETRSDYIAQVRLLQIRKHLDEIQHEVIPKIESSSGNISKQNEDMTHGRAILNRVEWRITDMHTSEKALLAIRSQNLHNSSGSMETVNFIILIIALILAGYAWIIFNKQNAIRTKLDNEAVEYAQELERKLRELTAAYKELDQLRSLKKYTTTGRIARMIAHEVRNPLTNINLSCSQLKEGTYRDENADKFLEIIMRNSGRINQLVNNLLNATKIQELNFNIVSVNTLLDEALNMAHDRIELEHILLVKDYDRSICDVKVDADKIKIAFLNIIVNGVEAMEAGGTLTIKTSIRDDKCIIEISDNGKGIDKDSLDKIFDPYFTNKKNGNGLGLTNTENIILTHNGTIAVESEMGKGTTFTIALNFEKHKK
jgi:signal transduction histidine kinase